MTVTSGNSLCAFFVLLLYLNCADSASLTAKEQEKYKSLIEGQGLYTADDDVVVLTVNNFNSELYGQKHAWLVEFYNSWCGFCQRFAPSWKALASDTRSWKEMVKIGAIDCSNEENSQICREFEIMAFPTLRYFHEFYEAGPKNYGEVVPKGEDMNHQRQQLVAQILKEVEEGRGKMYPNLLPYNESNLSKLFLNAKPGAKYAVLIFNRENSSAGAEVALDLHTIPEIIVRFTSPNNTDLVKYAKVEKFPSMVVMDLYGKTQKFADGLKTRESMKMAIRQFMERKSIDIPQDEKREIFTGKWLESDVPDSGDLMEAYEKRILKEKVKKMKDVVFQIDLETALRWSLKREVSRTKTITGEKRTALINYLEVIIKYFPLGVNAKKFIMGLKDKVSSRDSIEGKEISEAIKTAEGNDERLFSSTENWLACEGSAPEHRGYPCGLWKMFHFLTVSAAENDKNANPLEVLKAMEGYIGNFFGCHDCAEHFLEMAQKMNLKDVESLDGAILWLWMAHNTANKRLAGDATEDPEYPKIQFPSQENCPQCRHPNGTFIIAEVLKYLKHMYSGINVRYIGSDTRVLHAGLGSPSNSSSNALKGLDTSMCILYSISFFLLIFVVFRMFIKRGYRKKLYVHDLLGKV